VSGGACSAGDRGVASAGPGRAGSRPIFQIRARSGPDPGQNPIRDQFPSGCGRFGRFYKSKSRFLSYWSRTPTVFLRGAVDLVDFPIVDVVMLGSDFIYTENSARPRSDFLYTKSFARPRSGFYLHKEFRPAEILILSTQRIPRGRDPNFLYTKNFIRKIMKI